jgi:hypothetical protein
LTEWVSTQMLFGRLLFIGRIGFAALVAAALLASAPACRAVSCTTQGELQPQDRNALTTLGGRLAMAVVGQDFATLQAALLPAEATEWTNIHDSVELGAPLVKGGQVQLRNIYLLDASALTAAADTQFFCSNTSGSLTVTMTMRALPAGKYAVVLADAAGAPLGGQMGMVLAWDPTGGTPAWKLAGLSVRQGTFDGHDGVWYWTRARELVKEDQPRTNSWPAWFSYEAAHYLLLPVDFLSSPNSEKLAQEQTQVKNSPQDVFPYALQEGDRIWKIDAVHLDASLHQPDLAVEYESTGVTDPAAVRTEASAVLSALLKAQPGLRPNFHGLWAVAVKDGKRTPVIELPMAQIP